jgi:hypothetical protein
MLEDVRNGDGKEVIFMEANALCSFPDCKRRAIHPHHVTYDPDQTEPLCAHHHKEITQINIDHSWPGHKLFYKERKALHREWKRGQVKPQRNPDDDPWIAAWNEPKY